MRKGLARLVRPLRRTATSKGAAVITLALAAVAALSIGCRPPEKSRFPAAADSLLATFTADMPATKDYEGLFRYFLIGFLAYRDQSGASATYPGLPSTHGERIDAMEGFTRFAPLAAA